MVVLKQILNLIPCGLINRHALETGVEAKARTFSVPGHLSAMLFAQLLGPEQIRTETEQNRTRQTVQNRISSSEV